MPTLNYDLIGIISAIFLVVLLPIAWRQWHQRRSMARLGLTAAGRTIEPLAGRPVGVRYLGNRSPGLLQMATLCPSPLDIRVRRPRGLDRLARALLKLPALYTGDPAYDALAWTTSPDPKAALLALKNERARRLLSSLLTSGCSEVRLGEGVLNAQWTRLPVIATPTALEALARELTALSFDLAIIPSDANLAPIRTKVRKQDRRSLTLMVLTSLIALGSLMVFTPVDPWLPLACAAGAALPVWFVRFRRYPAELKLCRLERTPWFSLLSRGWISGTAALYAFAILSNGLGDPGPHTVGSGTIVSKYIIFKEGRRTGFASVRSEILDATIELPVSAERFSSKDPKDSRVEFTYLPGGLGLPWRVRPMPTRAAATAASADIGRSPAGRASRIGPTLAR